MSFVSGHRKLHNKAEQARWRCHYCGRRVHCQVCEPSKPKSHSATRDHKIPRSRGGKGGPNLVVACFRCNQEKADREAGEPPPPRRVPGEPPEGWCHGRRTATARRRLSPMKSFPSEVLAQAMVDAVAAKHGRQLAAYPCDRCNGWHVALDRRHAHS